MRNLVTLFFIVVLLSGCNSSFLPGMRGVNLNGLPKCGTTKSCIRPVVVPITPTLLMNNPSFCYIYRIAPQDVLSVFVWRHPEFNPPTLTTAVNATSSTQAAGISGYLVNYDGTIYFPLVGYISVAGKTIDEVRMELARCLKIYIPNPQVIVRVGDYRSKKIYVFGEVMKPGLLPLNDQPMSITDALTFTGSFDPHAADPRHIYVIRGCYTRPTIYWLDAKGPEVLLLAESFHLQPGDVVYVSSSVMTNWNRVLNEFLPTITAYFYTQASIKNS